MQDITSGAVTYGHRFLATSGRAGRAIKVRSFDEYPQELTENFVVLSRIDRRDRIGRDSKRRRAASAAARVISHPQAESAPRRSARSRRVPAVVAGAFSAEFLTLPEEVLTTTLIHHQHFFPVADDEGP